MSHTKGLLAVMVDRIESKDEHGWINDGWIVAQCLGPDAVANARRLVACWNACAEISTDTLEKHGFRTVLADLQRQINEQWKERDELKAEIERLRNALQSPESIIALIGSNFSSKSKSMDGDLASVKYVLTAHDLVSAFSSLFDDKQEVK